jgi:hypothetical protein
MGLFSSSSAKKAQRRADALAREQFQWQKDQAAQADLDAATRRSSMEQGLGKIGDIFGQFDDSYYGGIENKYLDYAKPQIEKSQQESGYNLRSSLANAGKMASSTAARKYGDLASTYGGMYRDAQSKASDYAGQQRQFVNSARQSAVGQMYASESQDAGLQAANASVPALNAGPAFEPVSALLGQAAKFATNDYWNAKTNNQFGGVFSPMFKNVNSGGSSGSSGSNAVTNYQGT